MISKITTSSETLAKIKTFASSLGVRKIVPLLGSDHICGGLTPSFMEVPNIMSMHAQIRLGHACFPKLNTK